MIVSTYCPMTTFNQAKNKLDCPQCDKTKNIIAFKKYQNNKDLVFVGETTNEIFIIFRGTYTR
jgi:hypothetical protein